MKCSHFFWTDLEIRTSDFQSATLPPPPYLKMQIWCFWTDLDFRSSDLKSARFPPPNANLAFLDRSGLWKFRFPKCHFIPPPPNGNLVFMVLWLHLDFRSSDLKSATLPPPPPLRKCKFCISGQIWTSDFQSATLSSPYPPVPKANLAFLDRSGLQEFRFEKCRFNPPPPPPPPGRPVYRQVGMRTLFTYKQNQRSHWRYMYLFGYSARAKLELLHWLCNKSKPVRMVKTYRFDLDLAHMPIALNIKVTFNPHGTPQARWNLTR